MRTSEPQLNNAAGGRLYFTRPHVPETKAKDCNNLKVLAFAHDETGIKQKCQRSAETKQPTVGSFVLFQFYFTMCDGLKTVKLQLT